jgi:hypothetical protein
MEDGAYQGWFSQGQRFLALCLTGGAGVAVLGARRPYVDAWNYVVLGLLSVMLLPLVESIVLTKDLNDPIRIFFMGATIAVGVLNYVPTRAAPAALLLGAGCTGEMLILFAPGWLPREVLWVTRFALVFSPWVAALCWWHPREGRGMVDRIWLDFRDRFGLLWGQRVREQFNHAAGHEGWPVELTWRGLRVTQPGVEMSMLEADMARTLQAVLQRFVQVEPPPQEVSTSHTV